MTGTEHLANGSAREEMIEHLQELVHAIDTRSWHLERKGELEIARDAALLRQKALDRIAELRGNNH